ncbi:c-type cytochrome [Novosphingobium soli]|uniref:C-type cytochrome n=1 Tax=Novosphingobium soli TaxID=574956 RepID=A0ABV6CZM1_9SPHN
MRRSFLVLSLALSACGAEGGNPAFRSTGEVIAFSGGDGGAAHACVTCHGLRGEGDGRLAPRLAGLDAGYLHRQLDDYANGRRDHKAMRAVVRRLSGEDRARVAAYYAGLPGTGTPFAQTSALYRARCAGCHGVRGEGGDAANPPLAGQSPAYIAAQLEAWRAGKRRGDGMAQMLQVSRALTPEEVRLVAGHAAPPLPPARRPEAQAASR